MSKLLDKIIWTALQVSHSSEEVLQLKKEIARCQVEAEKMRTAIAQNKVCSKAVDHGPHYCVKSAVGLLYLHTGVSLMQCLLHSRFR